VDLQKLFQRVNNFTDTRFGRRSQPSHEARLGKVRKELIQEFNFNTIIDAGANSSQCVTVVRELGYSGKIFLFEPSEAFDTLRINSRISSS
jgi:hypothetical protein